jgi:FkbM family methyltransferase
LQVGAGRAGLDANPLPPHVLDLGLEIEDLSDTAAIMSGLDLMISSCTAPLHLAGALGVRTWALLPFAPYFPWLLERTDSPWYPSMRLYRQEQPGTDWSGVIARVAADLAVLTQGRSQCQIATPDCRHEKGFQMTNGFNELAACRSGLTLYNRNDIYIGASLRKYGEFSSEEIAMFRTIVQPGRTVLDVGANIGAHTVELSRLTGPEGVVHAFEPQRLMFQLLCANVALNSCANVFTHQAAAGAGGGTLLVPNLDPDMRNNYGGLSLLDANPGEPVPMVTIDSLGLRDCQFIKLDVEGMETEALRGAAETIERFRPFMYVENDRQAQSEELIGLLLRYGYRLYWHLPPLYGANNFRGDSENIFGRKVSVNMVCIAAEIPQSTLTNLREVTGPTDTVIEW